MSFLGTIEKLNVASVLQRIETFSKTGLLVVRQDIHWVELYCRDGHLLCVGPLRTSATLGERLLQDGVVSSAELQETMQAVGSNVPSETQIALTLMNLGYVTREELRTWATKKTEVVLAAVLAWSTGKLYFDENAGPPSERLLVSLSISSLLATLSPQNTFLQAPPVTQHAVQEHIMVEQFRTGSVQRDVSHAATLYDPTQFRAESPSPHTPPISTGSETLLPVFPFLGNTGGNVGPSMPPAPPQTPTPALSVSEVSVSRKRTIDTSFMQPDMVLVPADLSTLSEQYIQVTPDQWRLLTRIDGFTSLQDICFALKMQAADVCRLAGELLVEQLVHIVSPSINSVQELSPISQNLLQSGLNNGLATPGYASSVQSPWGNMLPMADIIPQLPPMHETYSQWGNGGNGATFVPGQGWVAPSQALQPIQQKSFGGRGVYTPVVGKR